jgi:hypothetical protein
VTALNVEAAKAHMIATGKLAKREERPKREEDGRKLARLKFCRTRCKIGCRM